MLAILKSLSTNKRIILLSTAERNIGKSFCMGNEEFGCVQTLNSLHRQAFGKQICDSLSTIKLLTALQSDNTFVQVQSYLAGDIILSVTEGNLHGHCGIFLLDGTIASNDSYTGKLSTKYNINSWNDKYVSQLGLKTFYFRKYG